MFPDNISYIFQKYIIRRDSLLNSSQKKIEYLGRRVEFPKIINVNYQNVNTNCQTGSQKRHKIEIEQLPTYYPPKKLPDLDIFKENVYQTYKEKITPMLLKLINNFKHKEKSKVTFRKTKFLIPMI